MQSKFKFIISQQKNSTDIELSGPLTEDVNFDEIFSDLKPEVHINLKNITRMNSYAIRNWIKIIARLSKNHTFKFLECSVIAIRQFNMISNMMRTDQVVSFAMPYYCNSCNKERHIIYPTSQFTKIIAPENKCEVCSSPLEFDDIEDKYLNFLTRN